MPENDIHISAKTIRMELSLHLRTSIAHPEAAAGYAFRDLKEHIASFLRNHNGEITNCHMEVQTDCYAVADALLPTSEEA